MRSLTDCKRIFFLHMRKAGGTTVRAVLNRVCTRLKIAFDHGEGVPLESCGAMDENTFLVVNFRHPVDRICSQYNYEGRRFLAGSGSSEPPGAWDSLVHFGNWFEQRDAVTGPEARPLWTVTKNYYVKSLCGFREEGASTRNFANLNVAAEEYRRAIAAMQRIDLVWICEWQKHENFVRYLEKRLLDSASGRLNVPHLNETSKLRGPFDIRRHLTEVQIQYMADVNRWDLELYRFACWRARLEAAIDRPRALFATA